MPPGHASFGGAVSKEWFIRLKRRIPGFDPDEDSECPNHPAIGRSIKRLDHLSDAQGWRPLSAFLSEDRDVAIDLLDDEDEDELEAILEKLGSLQWFRPQDALATVEKLVEAIEQMPRRIPLSRNNVARIVIELKDLQHTLRRAVERKVLFRFYAEFG
jgi:hypothetical protein